MQLFQEVTDPPVPITSNKDIEASECFDCDRSVRARETQDFNLILFYPHLNRLPDIISLVIYGVCKALLNCGVRIIEETVSLSPIRIFDDSFLDYTVSDILQRFPQLLVQRSSEYLFFNIMKILVQNISILPLSA